MGITKRTKGWFTALNNKHLQFFYDFCFGGGLRDWSHVAVLRDNPGGASYKASALTFLSGPSLWLHGWFIMKIKELIV